MAAQGTTIYLESDPAKIFRSLSDYFEVRKAAPENMLKAIFFSSHKYENQCVACERSHSVILYSSFFLPTNFRIDNGRQMLGLVSVWDFYVVEKTVSLRQSLFWDLRIKNLRFGIISHIPFGILLSNLTFMILSLNDITGMYNIQ